MRTASGSQEFAVDEAEDVVKEVSVLEPSCLLTKIDLSEVDIYSMYSHETPQLTPGSELQEDELYEGTKEKS